MKRYLRYTIPVLGLAMLFSELADSSNFVDDNLTLPGNKTDARPPTNPSQQWYSADANFVFQALRDLRTVAQRAPLNAAGFGAKCDGVADDATAINAALTAAAATVAGTVGMIVEIPKGTCLVGSPILIPAGVGLRGSSPQGTIIKACSSCGPGGSPFSAASVIRNAVQDGTQEYASIESLTVNGNAGGGATASVAVVDFKSLFVNSYIRDTWIFGGSGVGLRVAASNGMGPIILENDWVLNNGTDNVRIEELAGNGNAATGIVVINLTSEHQGTNSSALYMKGLGNAEQWSVYGLHIEQGTAATGRTGVTIDGVPSVILDGVQILANAATVSEGIKITNVAQNVRLQIRNVYNPNLVNPIIRDLKNSLTIGAVPVPYYVTPEVAVQGGMRFTPSNAGVSAAFQNSSGTDRAWFGPGGELTGASALGGAAIDFKADATNNRAWCTTTNTSSRVFCLYYPDATFIRFKDLTTNAEVWDANNSGDFRTWHNTTLNALDGIATFNTSVKGTGARAAAPSSGTHVLGEVVLNADPIAGGKVGWVCTAAGTPGTWKAFGAIDP